MLKKRLIFTLLNDRGFYMLSRNFRLQKVGDLNWIKEYYDFNSIAQSIDELIVLNVERGDKDIELFTKNISELTKNCFMPIAAGGGLNSVETGYKLFDAGADKLVVNTALIENPGLIETLAKIFGSQSIIASVDYNNSNTRQEVYIRNGSVNTGWSIEKAIDNALELGAGEAYLTSINRDGTGQGYDIGTLQRISHKYAVPIIASGGVGRFDHLVEGIKYADVQAVSTANLFNFMADGLTEARAFMIESGLQLAEWKLNSFLLQD